MCSAPAVQRACRFCDKWWCAGMKPPLKTFRSLKWYLWNTCQERSKLYRQLKEMEPSQLQAPRGKGNWKLRCRYLKKHCLGDNLTPETEWWLAQSRSTQYINASQKGLLWGEHLLSLLAGREAMRTRSQLCWIRPSIQLVWAPCFPKSPPRGPGRPISHSAQRTRSFPLQSSNSSI